MVISQQLTRLGPEFPAQTVPGYAHVVVQHAGGLASRIAAAGGRARVIAGVQRHAAVVVRSALVAGQHAAVVVRSARVMAHHAALEQFAVPADHRCYPVIAEQRVEATHRSATLAGGECVVHRKPVGSTGIGDVVELDHNDPTLGPGLAKVLLHPPPLRTPGMNVTEILAPGARGFGSGEVLLGIRSWTAILPSLYRLRIVGGLVVRHSVGGVQGEDRQRPVVHPVEAARRSGWRDTLPAGWRLPRRSGWRPIRPGEVGVVFRPRDRKSVV